MDVFQVVKAMRAQKPGAIQTLVRMGEVYCINFMYYKWKNHFYEMKGECRDVTS